MKGSKSENIFNVFNIGFMVLLIIVTLYPYINQLALSFSDGTLSARGGVTVLPVGFNTDSYYAIFSNKQFYTAFLLSASRVIVGTVFSVMITSFAAYAMTKREMPGRNIFLTFLLIPMFISGGLVPTFIAYRYLHLFNNYLVLVLPGAFSIFNMVVCRTFFNTIPVSIQESALIDGASEARIFFKIMFPLSMPVLATIALWTAVGLWNDWTTNLYFATKQNMYTLQYILMKLVREADMYRKMMADMARSGGGAQMLTMNRVTTETTKAATLIVATLPIIIVYPFLQKYFVNGVLIGSIKE